MMKWMFFAAVASVALPAAMLTGTAPAGAAPDLSKGKAQFARCVACHSIDPARPHGIGPNLAGIVGSAAGKQPGFRYSPGLAKADFKWTPEKLDAFIAKPRNVVPGTRMVFSGIPDPASRQALIAYLATTEK